MSNLDSLLTNPFVEGGARKLLEKHTVGEVSDPDKHEVQKALEFGFSNASKLTAQLIFETTLKYFEGSKKAFSI